MINECQIKEILEKPELVTALKKYNFIMKRLHQTDVSVDTEFQTTFRDFYQMRRFYSDEFASQYFALLEQLKKTKDVSFQTAIDKLLQVQGTYEMSFASKMIHTINPEHPIWDSVVTKRHFRINPPAGKKDKKKACSDKYDYYEKMFFDFMKREKGRLIIRLFDEKFPDEKISDAKKIDFVLWQDREEIFSRTERNLALCDR